MSLNEMIERNGVPCVQIDFVSQNTRLSVAFKLSIQDFQGLSQSSNLVDDDVCTYIQ